MKTNKKSAEFQPNRVLSYFKAEWRALLIVTVSGLIYNIGLLAGPWFEGTMTGYLVEVLNGTGQFSGMLMLVISFAVVTAVVQISRYVKRFYVRRFANNVNRRMKEFLYGSLVKKSRASLREEGEGNIMTKAILDVDDCVENNVLLGDSKNSDTYLNAACMKQEVAEMTDGKNTLIGSGGAYLSGGQAKRLAFVRTLCHDKPILILDDPFSALDKSTEKQAFVNLQALAKDNIVLLISHRLYLFPEMDGVIWMENGEAVGRASGHVPETLHNIRTIHCLGKEKYMEKRYDTYINESYRAMEKTNFYDAVYSPVILITSAVVVAVVMLLSASGNTAVLTLFGMSAGTAVAVINYISQIFTPVESLGMEIQTIQSALAGIHRINEFFALEENPDTVPTHEPKTITARSGSVPFVEFRDVTFGYDKRVVLDHLSFKVMDGDQVTLTGRTGAGKSTIFKLLLGLYKPQSGEVLIHGVPAADIRDDERRRLFGYVEQTFHMVPGTVRDQITLYDSTISDEAVHTAAELTGLKGTIESMEKGYDTRCTDDLFSQGQWQLLSIARAAAAAPSMLLFDEITANLDAETERAVLSALKRVAENRTVISISHRTSAELGRIIALTD